MQESTVFARSWRAVVLILSLLLGTTPLPGWAQAPAPVAASDPARLAASRQLVDWIGPAMPFSDPTLSALSTGIMPLFMAFNPPKEDPGIDFEYLPKIAKAGSVGEPGTQPALVAYYARTLSLEDPKAILAFYKSPDGRRAMIAHGEQGFSWLGQAFRPSRKHPIYIPTPAEAAFLQTPAGQALAAANANPGALEAAREDIRAGFSRLKTAYCNKRACGPKQDKFFSLLAEGAFAPPQSDEHRMAGGTAGELFPDTSTAQLALMACEGDLEGVAAALKDGADPNLEGGESSNEDGGLCVTPLIWAIDCGNLPGIAALLDAGADPNRRGLYGKSPMTIAASARDPAILALLLARGGDPNAQDDRESTLEYALYRVFSLEVDKAPPDMAWANVRALLAAGADINAKSGWDRTFVETLASTGRFKLVLSLMDRYTGDPVALGRWVTMSEEGMGGDADPEREQVKAILIKRGVKFPVLGLSEMKQDDRGFYIQP